MTRTIHLFVFALLAASAAAAQTPSTPAPPASAPAAAAPSAPAPVSDAPSATADAPAVPLKPASHRQAGGFGSGGTGVAAGGQGYTYNAEGRRDPFRAAAEEQRQEHDIRRPRRREPPAWRGSAPPKSTLRGVLTSQGGYVGMLPGHRRQDLHRAHGRQAGGRHDSDDYRPDDGDSAADQGPALPSEGARGAEDASAMDGTN